jgi:hypothetical protein
MPSRLSIPNVKPADKDDDKELVQVASEIPLWSFNARFRILAIRWLSDPRRPLAAAGHGEEREAITQQPVVKVPRVAAS